MKGCKFINIVFLSILVLLFLGACGSDDKGSSSDTTSSQKKELKWFGITQGESWHFRGDKGGNCTFWKVDVEADTTSTVEQNVAVMNWLGNGFAREKYEVMVSEEGLQMRVHELRESAGIENFKYKGTRNFKQPVLLLKISKLKKNGTWQSLVDATYRPLGTGGKSEDRVELHSFRVADVITEKDEQGKTFETFKIKYHFCLADKETSKCKEEPFFSTWHFTPSKGFSKVERFTGEVLTREDQAVTCN